MTFDILAPNPSVRAKIRTGRRKGKHAEAVDHFISTDAEFTETFPHAKELTITFPFQDPERCLKTGYEFWKGNGVLKCWSNDGVTRHTRDDQGDWQEGRCPNQKCHYYTGKSGGCCVVGRLRFKIPELDPYGLWQIDTKSWNTMNSIAGVLQIIGRVHPDHPFRLVLNETKSPKGKFQFLTLEPLPFTPPQDHTPPAPVLEQPQEEPEDDGE